MVTLLAPVRALVLAAVAGLLVMTLLPRAAGWHSTVVLSGSMAPGIRPGDVVVAVPVPDAGRVPKGTVLLVADPAEPGGLLLHRVVGRDRAGRLVTKGDANRVADGRHVRPDAVLGQARLRVPMIGMPVVWVRERRAMPLLALAALLGLLALARPRRRS